GRTPWFRVQRTSTSALPIPTTSMWPGSVTAACPGEIPADEEVEPLARGRRKRLRARDQGVREQTRALARPGRPEQRDQPPQHVLGRGDVLLEILDDRLDADGLVSLVPDVVVGGERQRGVAQLGLAGELGLGHAGHADHVYAPAPVHLRLGPRRELWALDADVDPAPVHGGGRLAGCL